MPTERLSYLQIVDDLEERIRDGEYPIGEKLPSHAELAEMYSVSLSTVQTVVRILKERKLIESYQGKGVFVADRPGDR